MIGTSMNYSFGSGCTFEHVGLMDFPP